MAETATRPRLLKQPQLQEELEIGKWIIDNRIARYPKGSENEFPVEYIGRWRRFDPEKVRAWFAAEREGFPSTHLSPAAA
jgi:hypothetical protein